MVQCSILKKQLPNLPKNTKNPRFFEFPKVIKCAELDDNYLKTSALPQSLTKMFFVSQTQKFMKIFQKTYIPKKVIFLWGGGGVNLLNVIFARFDAACVLDILITSRQCSNLKKNPARDLKMWFKKIFEDQKKTFSGPLVHLEGSNCVTRPVSGLVGTSKESFQPVVSGLKAPWFEHCFTEGGTDFLLRKKKHATFAFGIMQH